MRRRVIENIPAGEVDRELKLGPGGLRDVEFAVQLLQLVHGRADSSLRSGTTLDALAALARGGYVGRVDATQLDDAYRFLRSLEHRIQLFRLRRTHLVPEDDADRRRIGRSLGMRTEPLTDLDRPGGGTPPSSAGCTRSCSTARCSTPSPSSPPVRPGSAPGPPANAWSPSDTPTPPPRCAIWRPSPPESAARPPSSAPCCPCCSAGSRTPPTRTPGC